MIPEPPSTKPVSKQSNLQKLQKEITSIHTHVDEETILVDITLAKEFAALRNDLVILKWMVALVMVGVTVQLIQTFCS